METSSPESVNEQTKLAQKRIQEERMHDINLLLDNLFQREEVTIKKVVDCLYDVGSANIINQKFNSRTLNGMLKLIATKSKPVFRILAWRWFKSNCPDLLTKWLEDKVSFPTPEPKSISPESSEIISAQNQSLLEVKNTTKEIKRLRSQVRLLTGMLVSAITIFGGGSLWLGYYLQQEVPQLPQPTQSTTSESEAVFKLRKS